MMKQISRSREATRFAYSLHALVAVVAVSLLLLGCDPASETQTATTAAGNAVDSKFLLKQMPADPADISDAKQDLQPGSRVTVIGRIDAGEHDPFEAGKAMFVIKSNASSSADPLDVVDAKKTGHDGPGHDPDNCPFCKQRNKPTDSMAIVRFVDDSGQMLAQDARELLGVQKNQVVVVQGTAEVDPLGHLMIDADGLFIVR